MNFTIRELLRMEYLLEKSIEDYDLEIQYNEDRLHEVIKEIKEEDEILLSKITKEILKN